MKPQRSYTDPEIACYVLGLDMAEQTQDIQALLAHDDAAAARALKWETYLLSIVDALPAMTPPETLLPRIQETLGMAPEMPETHAPVLGEARERPTGTPHRAAHVPSWQIWLRRLPLSSLKTRMTKRLTPKRMAVGIGSLVAILIIVVLLVWASLRTTPQTMVHQNVPLQIH